MDVFAHFLWSVALFWHSEHARVLVHESRRLTLQTKHRLYAGFLGVLPDLLSFGLLFIVEFNHHILQQGPPALDTLPSWLFLMYNITHSIIIWVLLFAAVWIVRRKPLIILGAWGIHIIIDVFTHTPAYFPTPVFWPISDWKYMHGVSWGTQSFMIINYSALAIVYLLIIKHVLQQGAVRATSKLPSESLRKAGKNRTKYKKRP